jgi:hypothetical protein
LFFCCCLEFDLRWVDDEVGNVESVRTGQINNSPLTTSARSPIVGPSLAADGEVDVNSDVTVVSLTLLIKVGNLKR